MAKKTTAGSKYTEKKVFKDVCKENIGFFFILHGYWIFGIQIL